jgi:hypothetical protein
MLLALAACKTSSMGPAVGRIHDAGAADAATPTAAGVHAPPPAAGMSGAGTSDAGVHACLIPDTLEVAADDWDGGVDPACHDIPRTIIANNCIGGICHDSNGPPAGNLNLMAPCVAERLVNVRSSCQDKLLIDTQEPGASFLIDKLASVKPTCGEPMPFTGHLPPSQVACMEAWIHAVIHAATR